MKNGIGTQLEDPIEAIESKIRSRRLDLDSGLSLVVEQIQETTMASGAVIALGTAELMICRVSVGVAPEVGARLDPDSGLSGECIRTRKIIHCRDTQTDSRVDPAVCRELDLRSLVIWPVLQADKVVGVMEVFSAEQDSFSEGDLNYLARSAALVMKLAQEEKEARQAVLPEQRTKVDSASSYSGNQTIRETPSTKRNETSETKREDSRSIDVDGLPEHSEDRTPEMFGSLSGAPAESRSYEVKVFWSEWKSRNKLAMIGGLIAVWIGILSSVAWHRMSKPTNDAQQSVVSTPQQEPSTTDLTPPPADARPTQGTASVVTKENNDRTSSKDKKDKKERNTKEAETTPAKVEAKQEAPKPSEPKKIAPKILQPATNSAAPATSVIAPPAGINIQPNTMAAGLTLQSMRLPGATANSGAPSTVVTATKRAELTGGQVIKRVAPIFPPLAQRMKIQGDVELEVKVNKAGIPENIHVASGNSLLAEAAVAAVKQWRYQPYMLDGQPQEVQTSITLKFHPQ